MPLPKLPALAQLLPPISPALMSELISVPLPLFHTQLLTSSLAVDRIGASITALWGQDDAWGSISLVQLG